jgi:hypothetical protein
VSLTEGTTAPLESFIVPAILPTGDAKVSDVVSTHNAAREMNVFIYTPVGEFALLPIQTASSSFLFPGS